VEKIQSTIVNTIPLWKSQMVLALGVEHSIQAAEAQREVTDMTNELLKRNAEKLKLATIETAKESERGIVEMETLKTTNQALITTLDEVMKIQEEGRQKRREAENELGKIEAFIDELRDEHGFAVQRLEYGPGLGVPLFVGDDFADTLAPLRELEPDLRAIAERVQLTIEMGRFFATECGTYLTSINDLKANKGVNYCIVDGGINHLTYIGQLMGMKVPLIDNLTALDRAASGPVDEWCICGSLCTTNDVLCRGAELDDAREGDVLAFSNCGAYSVTEGVHLFLSRTMPRIIVRHADGSFALARDFTETSPLNTPNY